MGETILTKGGFNVDVTANEDLRTHQWKLVQFGAGGVVRAGTDASSGAPFFLYNKPNSGDAVSLIGPGNVVKAHAAEATTRGAYARALVVTGGWVSVASASTAANVIGTWLNAVASGSVGEVLFAKV